MSSSSNTFSLDKVGDKYFGFAFFLSPVTCHSFLTCCASVGLCVPTFFYIYIYFYQDFSVRHQMSAGPISCSPMDTSWPKIAGTYAEFVGQFVWLAVVALTCHKCPGRMLLMYSLHRKLFLAQKQIVVANVC